MELSGAAAIFFWFFAIASLCTGLLTIMARNAVHCALFLISTLLSVAAMFVLLGAEFVAGVQILVYIGGVMVLFLFVIMLVNVGAEERGNVAIFNSTRQVAATFVLVLLLAFAFVFAVNQSREALFKPPAGPSAVVASTVSATGTMRISRNTEEVGGALYRYAALPFEIASILLLVAIVGSVLLARTRKQELMGPNPGSDS
ncbi:MAG: NADH-quinone oxidoreductase subunit J [Pyrinomonadaceae bacterium]